ncbi:MAG: hypothetical protein WD534_13310 [Phycisphaeraceae bacterium]
MFADKEGLKPSQNAYDWLGNGIYFWENSPQRAAEWGRERKKRGKINNPVVVGAVIALGRCFDLIESHSLTVLREHHDAMVETYRTADLEDKIPINEAIGDSTDLVLRHLDCAVIEYMHSQIEEQADGDAHLRPFDSVRAAFWEGDELYPTAGFKQKNHIQICVRNVNCIKGYFRPLEADSRSPLV